MRRRLAVAVFGAWLALAAQAEAVPIFNPGNGHFYDFIPASVTWFAALAAADAMTLGPLDGYLVTITDAAENGFLNANYPSAGYWIAASDVVAEGTWKWMAGPETGITFWQSGVGTLTYANWNPGEPNNLGEEDFATENLFGPNWNDWCSTCTTNYVVEYSDTQGPVIPEPASLTLLGTGVAGLLARARRRRS